MDVLTLREGEVVAGKYRVEHVLGSGGMGVVLAATRTEDGVPVAIKVLRPKALRDPAVAARFFGREVRAVLRLASPHVAQVLDYGELPSGAPYTVLERLEGLDLGEVLKEHVRVRPEEVVAVARHALEALAEAHAAGIVHRDVKPSNLFLAKRKDGPPVVKVLDFGIAKTLFEDAAGNETQTDTFIGSPRYAAPEHLRNAKAVDGRADLWSLGVVLYELATGTRPFDGGSAVAITAAVFTDPVRPLRELGPDIPQELATIVERCLQRDLRERYQRAEEVLRALRAVPRTRSDASLERLLVGWSSRRGDVPRDASAKLSAAAPTAVTSRAEGDRAGTVSTAAEGTGHGATEGTVSPPTTATLSDATPPVVPPRRLVTLGAAAAVALTCAAVAFHASAPEAPPPEVGPHVGAPAAASIAVGAASIPSTASAAWGSPEPSEPVVVVVAPDPASHALPEASAVASASAAVRIGGPPVRPVAPRRPSGTSPLEQRTW